MRADANPCGEVLIDASRHEELRILRPSVGALYELYLLLAQRLAVSFWRVLLVRGSIPDVTIEDDKRRSTLGLFKRLKSLGDADCVVRIPHSQNIPPISQERVATSSVKAM